MKPAHAGDGGHALHLLRADALLAAREALKAAPHAAKFTWRASCKWQNGFLRADVHAELQIGNSRVMLNDAMSGGRSPKAYGGSPISLWVYVSDADALFNRAVKAGAEVPPGPMGQMADQFWGDRCGTFTDPFGYQWTIATRTEDLSRAEMDKRAETFFKQFAQTHGT